MLEAQPVANLGRLVTSKGSDVKLNIWELKFIATSTMSSRPAESQSKLPGSPAARASLALVMATASGLPDARPVLYASHELTHGAPHLNC
jgi:hypothetical protein